MYLLYTLEYNSLWGLRSAVRSQIVYTLVYKQAKAPPMKYKHQYDRNHSSFGLK